MNGIISATPVPEPKWYRVDPGEIIHRAPNGYWETTGPSFSWKGLSYRQDKIRFDQPISRLVLKFGLVNGPYPCPCSIWGIVSHGDFSKAENGVFVLDLAAPRAGEIGIGSAAPGHDSWMYFTDIYGEVFR